jgi:hypothetical protein
VTSAFRCTESNQLKRSGCICTAKVSSREMGGTVARIAGFQYLPDTVWRIRRRLGKIPDSVWDFSVEEEAGNANVNSRDSVSEICCVPSATEWASGSIYV